jgi:hypothetical protein
MRTLALAMMLVGTLLDPDVTTAPGEGGLSPMALGEPNRPAITREAPLRLVTGPDGQQHATGVRLDGVVPLPVHSDPDTPSPVGDPPPRKGHVDLRPGFPRIRDQGAMGACVGFGFSALADYMAGDRRVGASPQALWAEGRRREGTFPQNVGIGMQDAADIVNGRGNYQEALLPYPEAIQRRDPRFGWALGRNAGEYGGVRRRHVVSLTAAEQIWTALDKGMPVVVALFEPRQFDYPGPGGRIDSPGPNASTDGAHCVILVGYDDASRRLIVRNSWGLAWGDRGYGYMAYDYVALGYVFQAFTAI